jgi:hypothetical protein
MAQHDYNIANQTASSARTDINNAFAAIQSTNSGVAAPTTTVGNMIWYDTANNILQIRDEGNTAWITLGTVDQGNSTFEPNQTIATQAEAEAGVQATKLMTAQRVAQAIAALVVIQPAIGVGQTWQSVSRSGGVTYQNTTGKPIMVAVEDNQGNYSPYQVSTDGSNWVTIGRIGANSQHSFSFIVPNGHYYRNANSGITPEVWAELR